MKSIHGLSGSNISDQSFVHEEKLALLLSVDSIGKLDNVRRKVVSRPQDVRPGYNRCLRYFPPMLFLRDQHGIDQSLGELDGVAVEVRAGFRG
jgi:hypothetical protein